MSFINIFKIEESKVEDLKSALEILGTPHEKACNVNGVEITSVLYVKNEEERNKVKWHWILEEFSAGSIQKEKQAWSVVITNIDETYYALTFGNAFYYIDKFSNKDFAFSIGRKFEYKQIKSTAQANPNSNKNKTVVSYLDNKYFEYDSGESFIKIKGKIKLADDFSLFKENIEIGSSIKLDVENPSLTKCIQILQYINAVSVQKDITRIPVFVKVKNRDLIDELEKNLQRQFENDEIHIVFSDFDIIGTQEVFYSSSHSFIIKYGRFHESVDTIDEGALRKFCENKNLVFSEVALSLQITAKTDNASEDYIIKDLIDYTDENKKCVLIKGEWYQYNDDYLEELELSLSEFDINEDPQFDWSEELHNEVLLLKYEQEKDLPEYAGKDKIEVLHLLRAKYYAERAYNELLAYKYHYTLLDRQFVSFNGQRIEVADLYKDSCLIAVKIGNSSSKLCYALDQIAISAKCIKKKIIPFENFVKKVAALFVLDRGKLPTESGKIDLRDLNLLVLKNKLNDWKREMRHLGFEPIVYIGYKN